MISDANVCPPRHKGTFFADQDDVHNFVQDYCKNAEEAPMVCTN